MDLMKFDLKKIKLQPGELLYDKDTISSHTIIPARYIDAGSDNPDICALPPLPDMDGLIDLFTTNLPEYDKDSAANMTYEEKVMAVLSLRDAVFPLSYYIDLAKAIHTLLIYSYAGREQRRSSSNGNAISEQGTAMSIRKQISARPEGFALTGDTGKGKSLGTAVALSMYPKAIWHTLEEIEYVQIPCIYVTSLVGNLTEVYRSIAVRIDEILDTGNDHYSMIRSGNLGKCAGMLRHWIKIYHIGMIVIDEIQFLRFDSSASSFENIVGICEETGCTFGIIGNPEAEVMIAKMPRINGRTMAYHIKADDCTEADHLIFEEVLYRLWEYQWTDKTLPLTDDIKTAVLFECGYNISLLKTLFIRLQCRSLELGKTEIDAEFVHKTAGDDFASMRLLLSSGTKANEVVFNSRISAMYAAMAESLKNKNNKDTFLKSFQRRREDMAAQERIEETVRTLTAATDCDESLVRRTVLNVSQADKSLLLQPVTALLAAAREKLVKYDRRAASRIRAVPERSMDAVELDRKAENEVRKAVVGLLPKDTVLAEK